MVLIMCLVFTKFHLNLNLIKPFPQKFLLLLLTTTSQYVRYIRRNEATKENTYNWTIVLCRTKIVIKSFVVLLSE